MTTPNSRVDFRHLVEVTQALGRAVGVAPISAEIIEDRLRAILAERALLESVAMGLISTREAASALLDRAMTWMLVSQSRQHPGLSDYSWFETEALHALFGEQPAAITASN